MLNSEMFVEIGLNHYLIVAALLFAMGMAGVLLRRNVIVIMMSIEIMLNAVNLSFVAYARQLDDMGGQMAVFFIIVVAAAESAVGLGLLISMFRTLKTVDTDEIRLLKE